MATPTVRILVGAGVDASVNASFKSIAEQAKKARAAVDAEFQKAGAGMGRGARSGTQQADKAFDDLKRRVAGLPAAMTPATRAINTFGKEASTNFALARTRFNELAKDFEKDAKRIESASKVTEKAQARASARFERRFDSGARVASRVAMGAISGGMRLAGDVARGAGIETSAGAYVAKNVELETRAQDLSNAGYDVTDETGRNNRRIDKRELMAQAFKVGTDNGFDPNQAIEGLSKFVGKTGDLATGRDVLGDLAKYSKATGTELEHMVDAAGDVSNVLGPIPDKAQRIRDVMRAVAGQGKLGAVEISDMAKQMAKVAAAASQLEGDPTENMKLMGAFAQESRQRGGSASATQAATSVASMINTFKTPARVAAFAAQGISVYNKSGQIRNPEQLVMEALNKQGLNPTGFKAMFANVQGARAVEGFASIYRSTYANTSGDKQHKLAAATEAVRDEFQRLKTSAIGVGEMNESFRRSMETTASQAQVFNNQLQATTLEMQAELLPALKDLAPVVLSLAKGFTDLIGMITGEKEKRRQKGNFTTTTNALNTTNALHTAAHDADAMERDEKGNWRHVAQQGIAPELLPAAKTDLAALDAAIEKQRQEVIRARKSVNTRQGGTSTEVADDALGGSAVTKMNAEEGTLARMQEQRDDLKTSMDRVYTALTTGQLRVEVVNQAPSVQAPVRVDTSGRMAADSSEDNP